MGMIFLDMIIKFDLKSDQLAAIKKMVREGGFSDIHQFIEIAIENQIREEFGESKTDWENQVSTNELQSLEASIEKNRQKILHLLSNIPLEESELICTPSPLIWSFYNRFFPIKVVARALAIAVTSQKWIPLSDFQNDGVKFAEIYSDKLKEYEEDHKIPRNKKLSTGLPMPKAEVRGFTGDKYDKKNAKYIASKERFQDQFIGRFVKRDHKFFGACYEMGLMSVKVENNIVYVSLTDLGRDFALLENPVLDNDQANKIFNEDEILFIKQKLIPRFKLEQIIIDKILHKLESTPLRTEGIDEIFQSEINNYFDNEDESAKLLDSANAYRVATMGRLTELGLVDWAIVDKGKSVYSLPTN